MPEFNLHKAKIVVTYEVFSSDKNMSEEQFIDNFMSDMIRAEVWLNTETRLRWHLKQIDDDLPAKSDEPPPTATT